MKETISVNTVKTRNRAAVFQEIVSNEELTRNELARRCGVSLGTVATILDELGHLGVVVETKDSRTSVGRKPNIVRVVRNARKILALDLASRNFVYEFLDVDLREESHGTHHFEPTLSFEENLRTMLREIRDHMEQNGLRDEAIIGVGVSVPGSYRYGIDRIDNSPFPELHTISLKTLIQEYFSQPILIDHDVFLAARAEIQHYPEYEKRNVFYVFLGEGVGGALVAHGKVYKGAREDAGDIGRVLLNDTETLEDFVSWIRTEKLLGTEEDVSAQLNDPESPLRSHLDAVTRYLARVLHNLFWILDPNSFIIGGEYQRFGRQFIDLLTGHLEEALGTELMQAVEVKISRHGSRGARLGAGEIVREDWLNSL